MKNTLNALFFFSSLPMKKSARTLLITTYPIMAAFAIGIFHCFNWTCSVLTRTIEWHGRIAVIKCRCWFEFFRFGQIECFTTTIIAIVANNNFGFCHCNASRRCCRCRCGNRELVLIRWEAVRRGRHQQTTINIGLCEWADSPGVCVCVYGMI